MSDRDVCGILSLVRVPCFLQQRSAVPAFCHSVPTTCSMSAEDDVEIVASGAALSHVSHWLGEPAEAILQATDPKYADMFEKPRPLLLGLGAKFLSHKLMEKSGIETKLKHRLQQSAEASGEGAAAYQPAQLIRHQQHQRKRKHGQHSTAQEQAAAAQQDSDEEDGKLARLKEPRHSSGKQPQQKKLFDKQQLLAVPVECLSKWQRKRMRQKAKQHQ